MHQDGITGVWYLTSNLLSFKYLVHLFTATDDNWTEILANLRKVIKKWSWMSIILKR